SEVARAPGRCSWVAGWEHAAWCGETSTRRIAYLSPTMSDGRLTAAAIQMSSQDDLAKNLARASERIAEAAGRGAELVVLPQNFPFMGSEPEKRAVAEPIGEGSPGPIVSSLAAAAAKAGVHVIGGGMAERSADPDRPYNTCVVIAPDGAVAARYRKIHLF